MRADRSARWLAVRRGRAVAGALALALAVLLGTASAHALTSSPRDIAAAGQQSHAPWHRPASAALTAVVHKHTHSRFAAALNPANFDGLVLAGVLVSAFVCLILARGRRRDVISGLRALLRPGRGPPPATALAGCSLR
jgi:hypothetical protein